MPRTLLVTGAAGFIGSHTVEALLARGDHVVALDDFDDYYDPALKRRTLSELRAAPGAADRFTFVEADIRDEPALTRLFADHPLDAVIHLAAMAGVRASIDRPAYYYDVNVRGTLVLLEAARAHGQPNFVFASTSSVYGHTATLPFVETDPADRPLAPYPASKRAGELLGHSYHHVYGLDFTALRFFTVYGPRNRPDMMAHKVLTSCADGTEVPLFNAGRMGRDWTYVKDIAAGVLAAADRRLGYEQINLGRGEPVELADFIREVEARMGAKAHFVDRPAPPTDMLHTHADVGKARRLLGYSPSTSVAEGVEGLVTWYRNVQAGAAGASEAG